MKFLLAPLIVVAFILTSFTVVTALPNNPTTSCKKILECKVNATTGYYWVNTTTGCCQVENKTTLPNEIPGGWMRAVYINATETCPEGLNYTNVSCTEGNNQVCSSADKEPCTTKHMCIRSHTDKYNCSSVTFPTHGVNYTRVLGRACGYQYRYTPAFRGSHYNGKGYLSAATLNDAYVSGVSVTYGRPRNHIWTFAAGWSKDHDYETTNCPCAQHPGPAAPPFVGKNYFCESGNTGRVEGMRWHLNDTLWDSKGCVHERRCCNRSVIPPWFDTTLSNETSDDIEVRLCHYFGPSTKILELSCLRYISTESTSKESLRTAAN